MSAKLEEECHTETFVAPHWLPGGQSFWYRRTVEGHSYEFIMVDIIQKSIRPAFDHEILARQLQKHTANPIDAGNLPFTWIEIQDDLVCFRFQKHIWQYDIAKDLLSAGGGLFTQGNPAIMYSGGLPCPQSRNSDVPVSFVNNTKSGLDMYAVLPNGESKLYMCISQGQTLIQRSHVGVVWKFVGDESRLKGIYCVPDVRHANVVLDDMNVDEYMGTHGTDLPVGWEERISESGRLYYIDHNTKSTSWRLPINSLMTNHSQQCKLSQPEAKRAESKCDQEVSSHDTSDNKWAIFIRQHNVWLRTSEGEEFQLSGNGTSDSPYDVNTLCLSPNKKFAVVWQYTAIESSVSYNIDFSPEEQFQPKLIRTPKTLPGDPIRVDRPRLFDLKMKSEIPTADDSFSDPLSICGLDWSGDGYEYRFLFIQRGHQCRRILGINCDGSVRVILEEKTSTFLDLKKLSYHPLSYSDRLIWASERDGFNHYYLINLTTGKIQNQITKGNWNVKSFEHVDEDEEQIWFSGCGYWESEDPYHIHFFRANFIGTECIPLTEGDGTHSWSYPWSIGSRHYFVDTWSRVDLPPQTAIRCFRTGRFQFSLHNSSVQDLRNRGWEPAERFMALGRDGKTQIYGLIICPPNFSQDKRYPVLEVIYAGPQDFHTIKCFGRIANLRQWAKDGYIVVQMDGMGTNWRSKAFHDVCYKNLMDAGLPDRILWIQEAAKTRTWMDLARVGIVGSSAGGQNAVSALLHHGHFYKVAVSDSGCHDNRLDNMHWSEQWMGYPVDESYADNSNITHAANLPEDGKLLLVAGGLDTVVDPASTMRLAKELNKEGKDYELFFISEGGHNCGGSGPGKKKIERFLRQYLLM